MIEQHFKPGPSLSPTKTLSSATVDFPFDDEVYWQQLMIFGYVVNEVIDAMERERATSHCRPLHQSWQNFLYQLRIKKPKLSTCLDNWLRDGFLGEQEHAR